MKLFYDYPNVPKLTYGGVTFLYKEVKEVPESLGKALLSKASANFKEVKEVREVKKIEK